ncbi:hypothetical protein [Flavobacterium hercynium]|uniref:DUF4595 domain-containing protein n=1 Tax=Flavobacterium hercynium TaxID=387094 RepID=A0A226GN79_9FLAO|nr:hypothetical protein [Flavobacterium hercynium]OXA83397.1 hypothetical protein B0A66_22360 [Flavobacterium hercynium]SMP31684.1 hypothetical protein SAMN06265346_11462 [Flavobacterium hercynium]
MKKILCLFCALTLALTSCSSDDSPSDPDPSSETPPVVTAPPVVTVPPVVSVPSDPAKLVLLKKVILTGENGKTTINYNYDGNKIVSIIDDTDDSGMYYTYTGDLITKLEFKFADGTVEQTNTFTYNADGKLATFLRVEENNNVLQGHKEVFTHNADGTITAKSYIGDDITQTNPSGTATIKFLNGEVSEITATNSSNHKYLYDDKNNPAKNILGFDKICFADLEGTGIFHNQISDTSDGDVWSTYSYTYNVDGYPVKSIDNAEGTKYTSEYFY